MMAGFGGIALKGKLVERSIRDKLLNECVTVLGRMMLNFRWITIFQDYFEHVMIKLISSNLKSNRNKLI